LHGPLPQSKFDEVADPKLQYSGSAPKRFVFLGASGRIGRLLRAIWSEEATTNLCIDWQFRCPQPASADTLIWSNLAELDPLLDHASLVGGLDGLFVFLGASQTGDKTNTAQMAVNVSLVDLAIKAAAVAKIPRVIVASSSAVYGGGHGVPFHENSVLRPVNAYGEAKRDMETLCHAQAAAYGIDVCMLRIGNVAGADALLGGAAEWRSGDEPKQLDVYPDGDGPRRSYIGPASLARVLEQLALAPKPLAQAINVAALQGVSMNALLDAAGIAWQPRPVPASSLQDIVLDCSRVKALSAIEASDGTAEVIVAQWRRALEAL
jgi:nucleoside-diphosphate-sugar epimerase